MVPAVVVSGDAVDDAYQALLSLGLNPVEARARLDRVLTDGRKFSTAQEILAEIYKRP